MNNKMTIWRVMIIGLILFGGNFLILHIHENVHVQIFSYYGLESTVDWSGYFSDGVVMTIPESACPDSNCILAHSITDAVGYHLQAVYLIFAALILFRCAYKLKDYEEQKMFRQSEEGWE